MHPRSYGFLHCVNTMCCTIKRSIAFFTVCNCNGHPLTKSAKPCGTKGMDQGVWITACSHFTLPDCLQSHLQTTQASLHSHHQTTTSSLVACSHFTWPHLHPLLIHQTIKPPLALHCLPNTITGLQPIHSTFLLFTPSNHFHFAARCFCLHSTSWLSCPSVSYLLIALPFD